MRRIYLAVALLFAHALQGGTVAPAITSQSGNVTTVSPTGAGFTVTATGTAPMSYQWQASTDNGTTFVNLANGGGISGANTRSLRVIRTSATFYVTGAQFRCVVSNRVGSATSTVAILTINSKPTITTQPANDGTTLGGSASFTVAAEGTAPITYQWRKNNVPIVGQTGATLTITGASQADVASYSVTVTNPAGSVTSKAARLIIGTAPSISRPPSAQTIVANTGTSFSVSASGTATLQYQWQSSAGGGAPFEDLSNGSGYSGVSSRTLKLGATNSGQSGLFFRCVITNLVGSVTSAPALLTVLTRPGVSVTPQTQYVATGASVTLTATPTGSSPITYQWSFNGRAISGATGAAYTIPSVTTANAGSYVVRAMNGAGSVSSYPVRLIVGAAPTITTQPVNDTVEAPDKAVFFVRAAGSGPLTYQWEFSTNNGASYSDNFENDEVFGVTTNTLTHNPTSPAQDGRLYRCVITNTFGTITSAAAKLTANSPPDPFTWVQTQLGNTSLFYNSVTNNGQTYVIVGSTSALQAIVLTSDDGLTWTNQPSPVAQPLYGVTYGNNLFVAVGPDGLILTSPNGQQWTTRIAPTAVQASDLNFVFWNGNQFIAVSPAGFVLNSKDGINWTVRVDNLLYPLLGVNWASGIFVAGGGYFDDVSLQFKGAILTSGNGATWLPRVQNLSGYIWSIAYGQRVFAGVGQEGRIFTSNNTRTWDERLSGTTNELIYAIYALGNFLAVGDAGTILTSADGIAWTVRPSPVTTVNLRSASAKGSQIVVVGDNGCIITGIPATSGSSSLAASVAPSSSVSPPAAPTAQGGAVSPTLSASGFTAGTPLSAAPGIRGLDGTYASNFASFAFEGVTYQNAVAVASTSATLEVAVLSPSGAPAVGVFVLALGTVNGQPIAAIANVESSGKARLAVSSGVWRVIALAESERAEGGATVAEGETDALSLNLSSIPIAP